jgi:hypothetical protein
MPVELTKVAAVLEAAADHIEAIETEKVSSQRAEAQSRVDELAQKYAEATGEDMPESIRRKLGESDAEVFGLLKQVVDKHASHVESLGSPSTQDDEHVPKTVKEAAEDAERRFLDWVTS